MIANYKYKVCKSFILPFQIQWVRLNVITLGQTSPFPTIRVANDNINQTDFLLRSWVN